MSIDLVVSSSLNGCYPIINSYNITPADHISAA